MDNNWSDPNNWSNGVPGSMDIANFTSSGTQSFTSNVDTAFTVAGVTIDNSWGGSGGTINVNSNLTVTGAFSMASGTLAGPANVTVTVSGSLAWTGGTMKGTGHTQANGGMSLDSSHYLTLDGRTIDDAGYATWMSGGGGTNLTAFDGAVWNNLAGSTLDLHGDDPFLWGGGAQPLFNNAGTLKKSSGPGSTQFDAKLVNSTNGTVVVDSGDLTFDGGDGGASHGSFSVTAGNTLTFFHNGNLGLPNDSFTLSNDSSVSGAGTVQIIGVTVNVECSLPGSYTVTATVVTSNGFANFSSDATLSSLTLQSGGTLTGTGNVTVSGQMIWRDGGTMSGTGSTTVAPTATLLLNSTDIYLDGRTINNQGTVTWTTPGNLYVNNTDGGVINNCVHATWDFQQDGSIIGPGTFNNAGTLKKSGGNGNLTRIDPILVNNIGSDNGTIEVSSGDLFLDGGDNGASHGSFISDTGSKLTFGGGTFTLSSDSSVSGAGTVEFAARGILSGTVNVTGRYTVAGPTLVHGDPAGGIGTANFNSNVTLSSLTLSGGGVLTGPGNVTVSGLLDWNIGTMTGTGSTTVARSGKLTIDGIFDETLDTRTLNNQGKVIWSGGGNVICDNGAVINNLTGASWDFQSDATIGGPASTFVGKFNNAGSMKKTKGTGTTIISTATFNNTGRLEVHTGTVDVNAPTVSQVLGSTLTVGSWAAFGRANLAATLSIGSAGSIDTIGTKASVTLSGPNSFFTNINGSSGLANIMAGGSFSVLGGQSFTTAGNLSNAGSVILSSGKLTISGAVAQLVRTSLTGGTWIVGPNSCLNFPSGSNITSLAGANVTLNGMNSTFAALANLDTIGNSSAFSLLGGRSFTTVGTLTNNGSLTLGPGSILTVSGSFTQSSSGTLAIQLGGSNSSPTFGQLVSTTGSVTLAGNLSVTSTVVPAVTSSFEILDNEGNSAISGTFTNLPEGKPFTVKKGSTTMTFQITYEGDAGNDVVITRTA
jgi:hypothetical protein